MKIVLFVVVLLLVGKASTAQKKLPYDFPDEANTDSAKKAFDKQFHNGQAIYKITCAKCHNKLVDGKETIPDFSLPQLMDYEIRIFPEHSEKIPETRITEKELANVVSFLRFRKKSGVK
ncbi:hypothetical protein QWZ08_13935 [Ferruginibacter paludis]|uniref:hypothetical protein n=1 Tax=Ferruginibacter paludis TaxID=1310417 RepID=UPI0025B3A2CA|nr:hypothetical protein [Ferruginibacter paludis]MDN3656741.1 hypothetical protein [Ferruginibacter paludis]